MIYNVELIDFSIFIEKSIKIEKSINSTNL